MPKKTEKKEEKLPKEERQIKCLAEINSSLKRYDCMIVNQPVWARGKDNTFSLRIGVHVIASP